MAPREVDAFLFDALAACDLVLRFTAGKTLHAYRSDEMLRSAVERQLDIVGEALRAASAVDASLREGITALDRIVGLRNRLAHAYATISDEVIWGIVEAGVPVLRREIAALGPKGEM